MKRKILISTLILVLVASLGTFSISYAESVADKQNELNDVNNKKKETTASLEELETSIKEQQEVVDGLEAELDAKQAEVDSTQAEIDEKKAEIDERKEGLNGRLRAMYKNGSIGYLDVLLSSGNISEFLSNLEMIQRIYKSDRDTLEILQQQKEELDELQAQLEEEMADIETKKNEADEQTASLKEKQTELQSQLDSLNADADRITGEIAAAQKPADSSEFTSGQFIWPTTSHYITSPFGYRVHPVTGFWTGHTGIDIGVGTGSPVYATASGTVILSTWYGGYGNAVVVDHGGGMSTLYGHNSQLLVSVGQTVSQGQVIAYSGSTGVSTGPHLHYEIRVNGSPVDPMGFY